MAVKTALIGLGIMGRRMLEHMVRHNGYEPIALWDPDPEACAQAVRTGPGCGHRDQRGGRNGCR